MVYFDDSIEQSTILRRYMSLPRLLDLLHFKALYLRRADGFADRLEGALFPSLRASIDKAHAAKRIPHNADYFYGRARSGNYVNCWTIGGKDSMALWQLYGGVTTSVVVTTTVERLVRTVCSWQRNANVHRVKYVDHVKMKNYIIGPYTDVLQFKHEAYKHERELRVVVPQQGRAWKSNPLGLRLAVPKLDDLIRSVVLAPESDDDYFNAVRGLCAMYGLEAPVRRSKLALVPV